MEMSTTHSSSATDCDSSSADSDAVHSILSPRQNAKVEKDKDCCSVFQTSGQQDKDGEGFPTGLVVKLEPQSDDEETESSSGSVAKQYTRCRWNARVRSIAGGGAVLTAVKQESRCPPVPDAVPVSLYRNENHNGVDKSYKQVGRAKSVRQLKHSAHVSNLGNSSDTVARSQSAEDFPSVKRVRHGDHAGGKKNELSSEHAAVLVKNRRKRSSTLPKNLYLSQPGKKKQPLPGGRKPLRTPVISRRPISSLSQDDPENISATGDHCSADSSVVMKTLDPKMLTYTPKPRAKRQQRFSCEDCGMGFRWQSRFDEHRRKHSGEKPFICRECGDAFSSSSYLRVHERTHSGKKPYPCSICGEAFSHGRHLTKHRKTHAEEGAFSCSDCGEKCASPNDLSKHRQVNHPEDVNNKPFVCTLCPAAFQRSYHLETHMRSHTGEKPFRCALCGQSYSTQGSLKVHIRSHTGERPFKCVECDRAFITSGQLKKHSRTHNKPVVTVSDDSSTVYVQTLKPVSPEGDGDSSEERGAAAESIATLKLEIQSYPKDRTYSCDICSSVFVRSCDLASHMRHDHPQPGRKENICRECGMCFSRAHTLKVHQRTHSGVKPFKCQTCGKEFAQRSNLTAHQRTHTQYKPYKCAVCGVSYSSAKYRDLHMLSHTEVRPCECVVCGSTFSSNALLSTHMRSHDRSEFAAAWALSAAVADLPISQGSDLNPPKYTRSTVRNCSAKVEPSEGDDSHSEDCDQLSETDNDGAELSNEEKDRSGELEENEESNCSSSAEQDSELTQSNKTSSQHIIKVKKE